MDEVIKQANIISLRDILFILFSKLHVLIGAFVIVITLVTIHTLQATNLYSTAASVLLKSFIDSRQTLVPVGGMTVRTVRIEEINSEIEIMKSRQIQIDVANELKTMQMKKGASLEEIVNKLGVPIYETPLNAIITYLEDNLYFESVTKSNVIYIELPGSDPDVIMKILNMYLQHYMDYRIKAHKVGEDVDFYVTQTRKVLENAKETEHALMKFKNKFPIINDYPQKEQTALFLMKLRRQLIDIKNKITGKQSNYSGIKKWLDESDDTFILTDELKDTSIFEDMNRGLLPLLVEKERIALLYHKSSMEYQDAVKQISSYRLEIRKKTEQFLNGMLIDLKALKLQTEVLNKEIEQIESQLRLIAVNEIDYLNLANKLEQQKKLYNLYIERTEEARINEKKASNKVSNASIINWASKPSIPIYPKRKRSILIGIFAGIVTGIGGAFAAYFIDHTIKTPEDIGKHCQIPILGSLEIIK